MSAMIDLDRLRYLASPDAERMSDYQRLNEFVKFGLEAADEIERLRALSSPEPTEGLREALETATARCQMFLDTFGDVGDCVTQADINDWHDALRAMPLQDHGWQDINTLPNTDDWVWLANSATRSVEGPRAPSVFDADSFDLWCECTYPSLPARAMVAEERGEKS